MDNQHKTKSQLVAEINELRRRLADLENLAKYSVQGIVIIQADRLVFVNPALCQILGYSADELLAFRTQQIFDLVYPEDRAALAAWLEARFQQQPAGERFEYRVVRPDGTIRWLMSFANLIEYDGAPALLSTSADITEQRKLEQQFHQSQKMEAIGRLAGGIAHDFNNILTVVIGNCAFILDDLSLAPSLRQDVEQIQRAAERAARLTRQLLAFSRQQVMQPEIVDVNSVVMGVERLLNRLIGEDIELVTILEPHLGRVRADPGQLEQVILNLAINGRDAMPAGGKLTIETANVYLDAAYARQHVDIVSGPYVLLAVSDTGNGMDAATQAHIYEPFFTTKENEQGTGLGLATVHGIVKQSGGHIWVYSEPGRGASFKIYLPEVKQAAGVQPATAAVPPARGSDTLLLVEDEMTVRLITSRILREQGYSVLEARNGQEALQLAAAYPEPIDLLLTDVIMPGGLSGRQLAEELTLLRPGLKVLYVSGYTHNVIVHHGVLEAGTAFLQKPFTPDNLNRKIREVLDKG
jgi:PAS domain S-box-containing protein